MIGHTRISARCLAPYHPPNNLWNSGKRTQQFSSINFMSGVNDHNKRVRGKSPACVFDNLISLPIPRRRKFPSTWESDTPFSNWQHWTHQLWFPIRSASVIFPQLPASSLSNFSLTCMMSFSDTFPISLSLYITYSDLLHVQNSVYSAKAYQNKLAQFSS